VFAVNAWIHIDDGGQIFKLVAQEKPQALKSRSLENIQYEVSVVTGSEKGAGTGWSICLFDFVCRSAYLSIWQTQTFPSSYTVTTATLAKECWKRA
jgi:hypothetical protein